MQISRVWTPPIPSAHSFHPPLRNQTLITTVEQFWTPCCISVALHRSILRSNRWTAVNWRSIIDKSMKTLYSTNPILIVPWKIYTNTQLWAFSQHFKCCIDSSPTILYSYQSMPNSLNFHLHVGVHLMQLRSARFGLHPFLVHTALILPSGKRPGLQL